MIDIEPKPISQNQGDYISLYDFIEWASKHYSSLSETASDLNRLIGNKNIQLYRKYSGISPRIDTDSTSLKKRLISLCQIMGTRNRKAIISMIMIYLFRGQNEFKRLSKLAFK